VGGGQISVTVCVSDSGTSYEVVVADCGSLPKGERLNKNCVVCGQVRHRLGAVCSKNQLYLIAAVAFCVDWLLRQECEPLHGHATDSQAVQAHASPRSHCSTTCLSCRWQGHSSISRQRCRHLTPPCCCCWWQQAQHGGHQRAPTP
jgi:hypothetical protein